MTPMSLQVASAQLRGQPETASLTLAGVHEPHMNFSSLTPSPVESCVPKRHQSEPTQVFTVRSALGVGVAGDHAGALRSAQTRGQVLLLDAQQVDALAAGDLDGRDRELVDHVGDGAQLARRRHAAPHARHDRVGAVLLDVGVDALVDEARLVVVGVFAGPGAEQIVVERRAALGAAARGLSTRAPA